MIRQSVTRRGMIAVVAVVLLAAVLALASPTGSLDAIGDVSVESGAAQPPLPTTTIDIEGHALLVELASTSEQRYMGLSFRTALSDEQGMLFMYPRERELTYTMRNTLLPLSIAYISDDWVINEIIDMDVGPGQLFPATRPAKYALEVNQGWFDERGIEPGARVLMK